MTTKGSMSATATTDPTDPLGPEALQATLASIEWIRRSLAAHEHPAEPLLRAVLVELGSSPGAHAALVHPWTESWIATAVHLIDREALVLLPDGQASAHFWSATNLLAALTIRRQPVTVRLDEHAIAWLPGTGLVVEGEAATAGLEVVLDLRADGRDLPAGFSLRAEPDLTQRADPVASADGDDPPLEATDAGPPVSLDPRTGVLIERWVGLGGRLVEPETADPSVPGPADGLIPLLVRLGVPAEETVNPLGGPRIREDASFDHLSLLAVRQPDDFAEVEAATGVGTDSVTTRLRAHVDYIRRRYLDAAAAYADLVARQPGDTDAWRDLCWALRHADREEVVRVWVLHPTLVVRIAESVAWQPGVPTPVGADRGPAHPSALERVIDILEWIADDLREG